jgi:hypothetical protein
MEALILISVAVLILGTGIYWVRRRSAHKAEQKRKQAIQRAAEPVRGFASQHKEKSRPAAAPTSTTTTSSQSSVQQHSQDSGIDVSGIVTAALLYGALSNSNQSSATVPDQSSTSVEPGGSRDSGPSESWSSTPSSSDSWSSPSDSSSSWSSSDSSSFSSSDSSW